MSRGQRKGENGKLLIVAGSDEYPGAAYLAAMAAYRTGIDIVRVCAPERVAWNLNTMSPDLITVKLKGGRITPTHAKTIEEWLQWCDAMLIGNGIGRKSDPVIRRLCRFKGPKVIDADAIKAVDFGKLSNSLLTPHSEEYKILAENATSNEINDNVILLKGRIDRIITADGVKRLKGGNSGMTVAGTGDVLAGLCAGYAASGTELPKCAVRASKKMSQTASILFGTHGYNFLASDFIRNL